jgi:transcriptional regulator with XRE-family HTH domain
VRSIGESVRAWRREAGLSLGVLARELSVYEDDLSALEHDERPITLREIRILELLLGIDGRRLTAHAELTATAQRLPGQVSSRSESSVDYTTDPFLAHPRARFKRSRRDIEQIATGFRPLLPIPKSGRIRTLELFERLDQIVFLVGGREYRADYAVRPLAPAVEARTRKGRKPGLLEVAVSPKTYRNIERGYPRTLFTVCHEIGHLVLHREELVTLERDDPMPTEVIPPYWRTEWQADAFAAAIISPFDEVLRLHDSIGSLSPTDVQREFGCSYHAAEHRLITLDRLAPGRIRRSNLQLHIPFTSERQSG